MIWREESGRGEKRFSICMGSEDVYEKISGRECHMRGKSSSSEGRFGICISSA